MISVFTHINFDRSCFFNNSELVVSCEILERERERETHLA